MSKGRIRWSAVLSAAVTVVGVLSDPHVLALLPAKAAAVVTVAGVVLQAITKPVHRTAEERTKTPPRIARGR